MYLHPGGVYDTLLIRYIAPRCKPSITLASDSTGCGQTNADHGLASIRTIGYRL